MKPGYKTTEFWLTFTAQILPVVVTQFGETSSAGKVAAFLAAGLATLGYSLSRAVVKSTEVPK